MSRECYVLQPDKVEVFALNGKTDMILRKNIEEVTKEPQEEGMEAETAWECEEVQYRHTGTLTREEIEEKFDYFWALAEGKTDQEATDEAAIIAGEPTLLERLETLEGAFLEFVEVMSNG